MILPVDRVLWGLRRAPFFAAIIFLLMPLVGPARAEEDPQRRQLQICLKKANDMPDIAAAEADAWLKRGGGDAALLCRAYAQFYSNEFSKAAADFTRLAETRKDAKRAALLYAQAGLAWMRAQSYKKSESVYSKALKLETQDPDIWVDRAAERGAAQHYWDAIEDLNAALKIMPDMPEALRLRGDVWFKLGNGKKAEEDFRRAAEIDAEDKAVGGKTSARAK